MTNNGQVLLKAGFIKFKLHLFDLLWICCGFVVQQVVDLSKSCGFVVDLLYSFSTSVEFGTVFNFLMTDDQTF